MNAKQWILTVKHGHSSYVVVNNEKMKYSKPPHLTCKRAINYFY